MEVVLLLSMHEPITKVHDSSFTRRVHIYANADDTTVPYYGHFNIRLATT
jgi:hypothetical protein